MIGQDATSEKPGSVVMGIALIQKTVTVLKTSVT
jgi:hypothetical protein